MIAIVAGSRNHTNAAVAEAWRALGLDARVVPVSRCLDRLGPGDVAIGRVDIRRSVDGIQPGLVALLELMRAGVRVLNPPAALLRSHDKLRTAGMLDAAGVAHPATEHITPSCALTTLRPPIVVKPRFGSWGIGVQRCDSAAALCRTLSDLEQRSWFRAQGALVQTLVPPAGRDLRVLVAGGRVVGAVSRIVTAPGEWRTNVSLGGVRQAAIAPPRAQALALAAARAVGADLVGVDLLPHGTGYVVIEVNGAVDFDDTYSLPGRSVFADVASALHLPLPELRHSSELRHPAPHRPFRTVLDGVAPAAVPATLGVVPGA
jgi:[lysine-biosynthesis-protein LysW]--L-2-aminoadipate ligase